MRFEGILDGKAWQVLLKRIIKSFDFLFMVKFVKHQCLKVNEKQERSLTQI